MGLFSKLRDYNNELEEILDRKTFPSVVKSLLLSMIYKLEISYNDYSQVKINCLDKETFFDNILDIVRKNCENIKTVEPGSYQAEILREHKVQAVTNEKERSIMCYPTEIAMLYAISDIEPKYYFLKKDFILKNVFQKVLVEGYKQNTVEILKNFNGWSWDINSEEKQNYFANLIYQNIMMIAGEEFLYEWRTDNLAQKDYLKELKKIIRNITGNNDYYSSLCKLLYLISNTRDKHKIKTQLEESEIEYKKYMRASEEFRKANHKRFSSLKNYHEVFINEKSQYEELIILQKKFLNIIAKKINRLSLREEIIEILYQLRYYQNIVLYNGVFVKDFNELRKALDDVIKLAITKACKMGVIKIISMNIETNFCLLKYVFDTKIIDLEQIKIYVEIEDDENIFMKVYDKEVFEKQGRISFDGNKKDIIIKKKRVIKLFN